MFYQNDVGFFVGAKEHSNQNSAVTKLKGGQKNLTFLSTHIFSKIILFIIYLTNKIDL
jgi:hypothetical protein